MADDSAQLAPVPGPSHVEGAVSNLGAHPCFSTRNLLVFGLLRFLQGRDRVFFCGSYTTPGNGHDLSLLSGLVAAEAAGAAYPFGPGPRQDFELLRAMMIGGVGWLGPAAAFFRLAALPVLLAVVVWVPILRRYM